MLKRYFNILTTKKTLWYASILSTKGFCTNFIKAELADLKTSLAGKLDSKLASQSVEGDTLLNIAQLIYETLGEEEKKHLFNNIKTFLQWRSLKQRNVPPKLYPAQH